MMHSITIGVACAALSASAGGALGTIVPTFADRSVQATADVSSSSLVRHSQDQSVGTAFLPYTDTRVADLGEDAVTGSGHAEGSQDSSLSGTLLSYRGAVSGRSTLLASNISFQAFGSTTARSFIHVDFTLSTPGLYHADLFLTELSSSGHVLGGGWSSTMLYRFYQGSTALDNGPTGTSTRDYNLTAGSYFIEVELTGEADTSWFGEVTDAHGSDVAGVDFYPVPAPGTAAAVGSVGVLGLGMRRRGRA